MLSSADAARKRSQVYAHLARCNLCPRKCDVNRFEKAGACLIKGNTVRIGTIAPHFGEEPCIQGHNGSGAVFFSGCNLRCVFCQNHDVAHTGQGFDLDPEALADWFIQLQEVGSVHNINLITPEHVVPQVVLAILTARDRGLKVPIIYNSSAYDSVESIQLLDGLVDIYLPDFKLMSRQSSKRLLKAEDYPIAAKESIKAMHQQVGDLSFTPDGIARKGLLIRHLVMPGHEAEGSEIMQWIAREVSQDAVIHIMEQYFPTAHVGKSRRRSKSQSTAAVIEPGGAEASASVRHDIRYDEINRHVKDHEINSIRRAAEKAGLWRFIEANEHGGFNI